jgi:hypothetical protein
MRYFLAVLALSAAAFGQCTPTSTTSLGCNAGTGSTVMGGAGTGSTVVAGVSGGGVLPSANAQLPLFWATAQIDPIFTVTKVLGAGAPDYPCATGAACFAAKQQAYCDWVADGSDQNWHVLLKHGTLVQTGSIVFCSQTGGTTYRSLTLLPKIVSGQLPLNYIVFDSDTPLTESRTVCAGAVDDTGVRQPPTGDISTWWTGSNYGCGADRASMWTMEGNWNSGNAGMLIQAGQWDSLTNLGPSHVVFKNGELRPIPSNVSSVVPVNLNIGAAFSSPTTTRQMASDIHFVNMYGHGDATDWCNAATGSGPCATSSNTGGPGSNRIATFMKLDDCANCSVDWSYFDYIISLGAENHVIGMARSPGPVHISQDWISGASSGIFGGGESVDDPLYSISNVQVSSDRVTQPPSWIGPNYNGPALTLKNRIEFKACLYCLFEGIIGELSDTSGGQEGQIFAFTPRNCSGGSICNNYNAPLQNLTIQKNICRHSLTCFSNATMSGYSTGNGGGASPPLDHVTIQTNLGYDLGSAFYDQHKAVTFPFFLRTSAGGASWVCSGTNSAGVQIYTCDQSVDGLRKTQIRPGDNVVITHCSQPSWDVPADGANVWAFNKGAMALSLTTPLTGPTVAVANPLATGPTATGCVLQSQGAPFRQIVQHNTIVMQSDAYPSGTGASGTNIRNLNGAASIGGGAATVTISGPPVVVPNVGSINVVSATIADYNCSVCLVTATTTSPNTITYNTPSTLHSNIDDTLAGWTTCIKPSCDPGGTGIPTSTSQTINNPSPSTDGEAMKVVLVGPANTNALWYNQQGTNNSATTFHTDFRSYVIGTTIQAIEFDSYQFRSPDRFMWGLECVTGGVWDIWNGLTQSWVHTAIPCSFARNTWHHVSVDMHRVPGDTSCASSRPCMYYDKLTVDGTVYTGFTPQPSDPLPVGWGDQTGPQFQLDLNGSGGAATEYIDQVSFSPTETLTTGSVQQPPNNASVYSGGGQVKIFTDTGCSGAGPVNSVAITGWSRLAGVLTATGTFPNGAALWPASPGPSQILVEVTGSGTATGTFYYIGASGLVGGNWTSAQWSQPGLPDETGATFGTAAQMGTCNGNAFAVSNTNKNNLVVVDEGLAPSCPALGLGTPSTGWVGWFTSGGSNLEGCPSGAGAATCSENHLDALTSVVTNTDFPGRCMNSYMEMGGAGAGDIPPDTLTGPISSRCPGGTVTLVNGQPSCVGMKSMMNGAPFDANNPDPSQYVLDPASLYKAGALFQADDGTDLGIGSFAPILNAIHQHIVTCLSFCGTAGGPFPD